MSDHTVLPKHVPSWISGSFRVLAALLTVLIFVQPVLAGLFITGDVAMLSLHSANATLIQLLSLLLVAAGILVWRPGHGSPRLMWVSLILFVLIGAQAGFGYTRSLAFHIPLGVLLFTGGVMLLRQAFAPMPRVSKLAPPPVTPAVAEEPAQ